MISSDQFDHEFVEQVLAEPGGEHLLTCWSCGTCAATCLVRRYEPSFNPRLILHQAGLGLRERVLSSEEIWHCSACDACYPRCPKQIHISEVMKAIRNIAIREGYERPGVTAKVDVDTCVACGMCVAACPYEAISLQTVEFQRRARRAAQVDPNLCIACGICNAVCPSSSVSVEGHTDLQCYNSLVGAAYDARPSMDAEWRGKALVIVCNWCLHAGSDMEYVSHPPEGVKVIQVSCSGRVTPAFVTTALQRGVDAMLIIGCKEDECHYKQGSTIAGGRLAILQSLMELLGVERGRVQFARLGSLDRGEFPRLLDEMTQKVHALGSLTSGD